MRTPLHGIIGIGESLLDGIGGAPTQTQARNLELIVQSGRRLSSLVNDLLDFSKMRNREVVLQLKPVDIRSIADLTLALVQPLIGRKPLSLVNAIPDNLPPVLGDEDRLQQILLNLLGNAVKFTHEGQVRLSAAMVEPDMLRVQVEDTGIGIPADRNSSIFSAFEQGDGSTGRGRSTLCFWTS